MLVRSCLKSCMLGFNLMLTKNFEMSKLGLEKEEELEIKLSTFTGLKRKQGNFRKRLSLFDLTKAFDCVDHDKWWKVLREMGIPNHFTCLLKNLYEDQEATVRILYGTTINWFKIKKGVQQSCLLSPCLFNLYAEHIMRNARLDELQTGIKIVRRNINSSDRWVIPL